MVMGGEVRRYREELHHRDRRGRYATYGSGGGFPVPRFIEVATRARDGAVRRRREVANPARRRVVPAQPAGGARRVTAKVPGAPTEPVTLLAVTQSRAALTPAGRRVVATNNARHGITQKALETEIERGALAGLDVGQNWYPQIHRYAVKLRDRFNDDPHNRADGLAVSTSQVAGLLASYSPLTPWPINKLQVEALLGEYGHYARQGITDPEELTALHHDIRGLELKERYEKPGLKGVNFLWQSNGLRAMRIMTGEPVDDVLRGPKIRAFHNNIAAPGQTDDVTVDTWMMRAAIAATSRKTGLGQGKSGARRDVEAALKVAAKYRDASAGTTGGAGAGFVAIADATRAVAARLGHPPDAIQAAYWSDVSGSAEGGGWAFKNQGRRP